MICLQRIVAVRRHFKMHAASPKKQPSAMSRTTSLPTALTKISARPLSMKYIIWPCSPSMKTASPSMKTCGSIAVAKISGNRLPAVRSSGTLGMSSRIL